MNRFLYLIILISLSTKVSEIPAIKNINLRDFFKINNKSITSRDLDDISFYSTNYRDSRSINISLTYKFYKGRRTNTKTFNSDEIGNRL
jgi:hypothetical protein